MIHISKAKDESNTLAFRDANEIVSVLTPSLQPLFTTTTLSFSEALVAFALENKSTQ
jgi:hypothetical protein